MYLLWVILFQHHKKVERVQEKARGDTNCLSYLPLEIKTKPEEPLAVSRLLLPISNLLVSLFHRPFTIVIKHIIMHSLTHWTRSGSGSLQCGMKQPQSQIKNNNLHLLQQKAKDRVGRKEITSSFSLFFSPSCSCLHLLNLNKVLADISLSFVSIF